MILPELRWNILQLLQQLNSHSNCLLRVVSVSCTEHWLLIQEVGPGALYWIFCSQNQGNFPGITPKWIARLEPHLWSKIQFQNQTKFKSKQNWRKEKASRWNRSFREKEVRHLSNDAKCSRQFVSPQIRLLSLLLYFLLFKYSFSPVSTFSLFCQSIWQHINVAKLQLLKGFMVVNTEFEFEGPFYIH